MKESFYFSHDYNAQNDSKVEDMRFIMWWEWYGIYWALVERLAQESSHRLPTNYKRIAFSIQSDEDKIRDIVEKFWLFTIEWWYFFSNRLMSHFAERESKSSKARENAEARWGKSDSRDKAENCFFYIIEIFSEDESFIKCWITSDSISKRYSWKLWKYDYDTIYKVDIPTENALKIEKEIWQKFKSYTPNSKFWWYLECHCIEDKTKILEFAMQHECNSIAIKERKGKEIKKKEIQKQVFISEYSENFQKKYEEWIEYRKQSKKKLTQITIDRQLAKCREWWESNAIKSIETSIERQWAWLFPYEDEQKKQQKPNGIDYEAEKKKTLEREKAANEAKRKEQEESDRKKREDDKILRWLESLPESRKEQIEKEISENHMVTRLRMPPEDAPESEKESQRNIINSAKKMVRITLARKYYFQDNQ